MSDYLPSRIRDFEPLLFLFEQAARLQARNAAKTATKKRRARRAGRAASPCVPAPKRPFGANSPKLFT